MSSERRSQERFFLDLQAKMTYRYSDDTPIIETVAANISSGGAFLSTTHRFPLAAKVQIEFQLSLEDLKKLRFILSLETLRQLSSELVWISTTGIVIRQTEEGVAIIFDTDYQLTPVRPPVST